MKITGAQRSSVYYEIVENTVFNVPTESINDDIAVAVELEEEGLVAASIPDGEVANN